MLTFGSASAQAQLEAGAPNNLVPEVASSSRDIVGLQPSAEESRSFNITGTWSCCGAGGAGVQTFDITDDGGSLSGAGLTSGGSQFADITGSASGNHVTIVTTYNDFDPGYVATFVGTISDDGQTISGDWSSNQDQSGTFTATRKGYVVSGTVTAGDPAKGVAGVQVRVQCAGGGVTTTAASGAYSLTLSSAIERSECVISVKAPDGFKVKPPEKVVKEITGDTTVNFQLECGIDETIDGWKLTGDCAPSDNTDAGATDVEATPPDGSGITTDDEWGNGQNPDPSPLPVQDADHPWLLSEPVELPDLDLPGGVQLVECSVDDSGLVAGQASFDFGSVSGLAQDLEVSRDGSASADELQLQFGPFSLEASSVGYAHGTFSAGSFTLGLPGSLGGGDLSGENLEVGPDGVSGTISPGTFTVGDATVTIERAGINHDELRIGLAKVILPGYLGAATLSARDLSYDTATNRLMGKVTGRIAKLEVGEFLSLGTGATLTFDAGVEGSAPSYTIDGDGKLFVKAGGEKLLGIEGQFKLASVSCAAAPPGGPCDPGRATFLKEAGFYASGPPVPIASTGLELTGIGGGVKSSAPAASINEDGQLQGVSYTFTVTAGLRTSAHLPDGTPVFDGTVDGSLSTTGNLKLSVPDSTILGILRLHGQICIVNNLPDDVCDGKPDPGYYVAGTLSAQVSGRNGGCHGSAGFTIMASGELLHLDDEQGYVEATGTGEFDGSLNCEGIDLRGHANAQAQLGYFSAPGAARTYGIKLDLDFGAASGSHTFSGETTIFIRPDRTIVLAGAKNYELLNGTPDASDVGRLHSASAGSRGAVAALASTPYSVASAADASDVQAGLKAPRTDGQMGCDYAIALVAAQTRERAASNLLPDPRGRFPDDDTGTLQIPTFPVGTSTACIAANDAAAIETMDPSTGGKAVTVGDNGDYVPYTMAAPDLLTYGKYSGTYDTQDDWEQATRDRREEACGDDPFFEGHEPGPTDLKVDAEGNDVDQTYTYTSCDEYPFASSLQGGATAIIRGVPLSENRRQGGQLSAFFRRKILALKKFKGQFYICVYETYGHC